MEHKEYYCQYCGHVLNGKTCAEVEKHVNECFIKTNKGYKQRVKAGLVYDVYGREQDITRKD